MHFYYDLPIDLTAQNNFIYGKINVGVNVPATERDSPFLIQNAVIGQSVNLGAKNQPYGGYERVWNDYALTNQSNWLKNGVEIPGSINKNYSFQVTQSDDDAVYEAGLRKNYAISRNDQTELDGTISNGVLWHIVEQNSGQISAPGQQTINGKNYNYVWWSDNITAPNPRTITPTDNTTYTAMYKFPNHSNEINAYSSNSQKKLVRDSFGYLHKVYSSMGYVWYEKSTDNGVTWEIMNDGKPLSSNEAKLPAIDYYGNYIFITWQERYSNSYKIRLAYYQNPGWYLVFNDVYDASYWAIPPPYSDNAAPVIAWAGNRILIAFKFNGIVYRYGYVDTYGPITWYTSEYETWVPGTDQNSINPTIAVRKDGGATAFHLV